MKAELVSYYRAPGSGQALALADAVAEGDEIVSGSLIAPDGARFPIEAGMPNFIWPQSLGGRESEAISFYD
ncbi:MAG: hypothetical protein ACREFI_03290, partial [Stellaceae bacterium]